jgi:hypothetical protein
MGTAIESAVTLVASRTSNASEETRSMISIRESGRALADTHDQRCSYINVNIMTTLRNFSSNLSPLGICTLLECKTMAPGRDPTSLRAA